MVVLNENLMGNMARMKKFIDNLSVSIVVVDILVVCCE